VADLKLNALEWNSIDPAQQARIKQILVDCKLISQTDRIVPDPSAPTLTQFKPSIANSLCKATCTAAEALAVAACTMLSTPAEVGVCTLAALTAGELCKSQCGP
jgi:hypothetical protein